MGTEKLLVARQPDPELEVLRPGLVSHPGQPELRGVEDPRVGFRSLAPVRFDDLCLKFGKSEF